MDVALVKLPPLILDWLGPDYITRDELELRDYDVPCYPYTYVSIALSDRKRYFDTFFRHLINVSKRFG